MSPIALPGIATSLAVFAVVYFTVFGAGVMVMLRMMAQAARRGRDRARPGPAHPLGGHPSRPARRRATRRRRRLTLPAE